MMALVGTLSFNFQVLLPLLAAQTWHGRRDLRAAHRGHGRRLGARRARRRRARTVDPGLLVACAALFGVAELLAALAPTLEMLALALVPLGAASVTFAAGVNSSLQLAVGPALRGRVMALYAIVFLGSTRDRRAADRLARPGGRPACRLFAGAVAALLAAAWAWAEYRGRVPRHGAASCTPS